MSRLKARPRADHQHAADQARQMPSQWVLAGTYGSSHSARDTARQVRSGDRISAYRPAGAFEARTEVTQDGADLWVSYVAQAHDFHNSIASGLTEDLAAFSRRLDAATTSKDT